MHDPVTSPIVFRLGHAAAVQTHLLSNFALVPMYHAFGVWELTARVVRSTPVCVCVLGVIFHLSESNVVYARMSWLPSLNPLPFAPSSTREPRANSHASPRAAGVRCTRPTLG